MICLNCGRKLRSAVSREVGYGPVCYRKMFGTSLRSSRKDNGLGENGISGYNMPGQITIEEYMQTLAE